MADIGKFSEEDVKTIPLALVVIMEFMLAELLIPGQVENYILIMNLAEASFGMRSVLSLPLRSSLILYPSPAMPTGAGSLPATSSQCHHS